MNLEKLFGSVTGIGSLPHTGVEEALQLIFTYFRQLPHWPQLPRRSAAEGFAAQYLDPLFQRELIVTREGRTAPYFDHEHPLWEERCLSLLELLVDENPSAVEEFAFPRDAAAGFYGFLDAAERLPAETICLKGQLSGPVTIGFQVTDASGKPSFYNPPLRELLVKTLAAQARWQASRLQSSGRPALLFIDDPGLYSYGSSSAVGLGKAEIQAALGEIIAAVRATGCFSGVHCCAGADWSLLFELPLDLVSFDAYEFFPSMQACAEELENFLRRGGALAWGIVPTSEKAWQESPASLQRLWEEKIESLVRLGVSEPLLRRQYLITPACGTGTLQPELAAQVYRLAAGLAERL